MTATLHVRLAGALAAALSLSAASARAQEVRVEWIEGFAGHELLGDPSGAGLGVTLRPAARVGLRLSGQSLSDRFSSFGSTCVGLSIPSECLPESRADDAAVRGLALAAVVTAVARERVALRLVPELGAMRVESEQRGLESGRTRTAEEDMLEVGAGLEASAVPVAAWPLRLHVAVHVAVLSPLTTEVVADGYTPFDGDTRLTRVRFGASYTF